MPIQPAVAAICPNDGACVTLNYDAPDATTGVGLVAGNKGHHYVGQCGTCGQRISKEHVEPSTKVGHPGETLPVGVAPTPIASSADAPADPVSAELLAEFASLSPEAKADLVAELRQHNADNAQREAEAAAAAEAEAQSQPEGGADGG